MLPVVIPKLEEDPREETIAQHLSGWCQAMVDDPGVELDRYEQTDSDTVGVVAFTLSGACLEIVVTMEVV